MRSRIFSRLSVLRPRSTTFGPVATASFLICVLSGVIVAVPYDVTNPYESLTAMILSGIPGALARNIHYWSAQLFLVTTILHFFDHLKRRTSQKLKWGVWLRLTLSLAFIFFAMLSGFILKGDPDGQQAFLIFSSLTESIPIAGPFLKKILIGADNGLQLMYVNHIATATLFLAIVIAEHSRTVWTDNKTFFYTLSGVIVAGFFLQPPIHDGLNPAVKGPWYFIGMQEALHWLSDPWPVIAVLVLLLVIVFISKYLNEHLTRLSYRLLILLLAGYGVLTVTGYLFRGTGWEWTNPWEAGIKRHITLPAPAPLVGTLPDSLQSKPLPSILGRKESCVVCHSNMTGFSPSHDPAIIGCSSCHLGNPYTLNDAAAHLSMVLVPGNLDRVELTCGAANCHHDISERIQTNIMTTLSGMISVDRWAFGESNSLSLPSCVNDLGKSAADEHLRNLCVGCHLGATKELPGPVALTDKGGSCNSCHLIGHDSLNDRQKVARWQEEERLPRFHPSLRIKISNDKCFKCHNRSGRISTNYEGWFETLADSNELKKTGHTIRVIDDHRVFASAEADVHHKAGLDCIDCHTSYELMGDGITHLHKEQQVKTQCSDCHRHNAAENIKREGLDQESVRILALNNFLKQNNGHLRQQSGGRIYVNTSCDSTGNPFLISQNTGVIHQLKPPAQVCQAGTVHHDLSCQSCHSAWVPTCLGCHNTYDATADGFDHKKGVSKKGTWVEAAGVFLHREPTLGVVEEPDGKRTIKPFTPGMVLTIDKSAFGDKKPVFKRLFAPADPHTTVKEGRQCVDCHLNPVIIGYGEGKLTLVHDPNGTRWKFEPAYELRKDDDLPEDAWTGFLKQRNEGASTRPGHRPFNIDEQNRILLAGSCLTCHDQDSKVVQATLNGLDQVLKRRSRKCLIPDGQK